MTNKRNALMFGVNDPIKRHHLEALGVFLRRTVLAGFVLTAAVMLFVLITQGSQG
ncbi:MAG: hypothetical protein Q8M88_03830 [Phenylobacterium sp.]|uniref:hypothetical protein n=1 Tax=Phenylobacterium sp. TaxID=1871053 RepID=UPI002735BA9F|nr:hypothetical protein [Phenylobacterium sp.]MDP3173545.1 hypothetical protein [Phenylobacterium sp.]